MADIRATITPRKEILVSNFSVGTGAISSANKISSGQLVTTDFTNQVLDDFVITGLRTVKYIIEARSATSTHVLEALLSHDDVDAYLVEYGVFFTAEELISIDADINVQTSTLSLRITPLVNEQIVTRFTRIDIN